MCWRIVDKAFKQILICASDCSACSVRVDRPALQPHRSSFWEVSRPAVAALDVRRAVHLLQVGLHPIIFLFPPVWFHSYLLLQQLQSVTEWWPPTTFLLFSSLDFLLMWTLLSIHIILIFLHSFNSFCVRCATQTVLISKLSAFSGALSYYFSFWELLHFLKYFTFNEFYFYIWND